MAKISVIGAGMTGATAAHWIAEREIADVVLVDIAEGVPQGKALDLAEAMPIIGKDTKIIGTNDYADTADSDIVVITAGFPRKPGMSREDLLVKNANVVGEVSEKTIKYSPNAIYIVLTNPLDTMTFMTMKKTGLPANKVIGQAGVLDSARMSAFIAMETGVSTQNINCYVLGGHGDSMVPLTRHSNIAGVPLETYLDADKLEAIVQRTRKGGGEIVGLLKTGSAFYAPSMAVVQMAEAILSDRKLILPCAVLLNGEYGQEGIFFGVPAMLGKDGVENIIEYELNDEEKVALQKSADAVHNSVEELKGLIEL